MDNMTDPSGSPQITPIFETTPLNSDENLGENFDRNIDQIPPFLSSFSEASLKGRTKTSLRIRYEAEVGVIKHKIGSLEGIRQTLGISQRKMCQLLLVDPSAWSRWCRKDEDAPPHIYRMLQWYLALQDKYPALDVNFWLSTVSRAQDGLRADLRDIRLSDISEKVDQLEDHIERLNRLNDRQKKIINYLAILSGVSAVFVALLMGYIFFFRST